ncbi:hypothetical protein BMF94_3239 [Rhodotorula taiwanensis]|uniref:MYND-type domain-containing protein n=1 Tax=Rhodotorula taiwanensis TaxID=741276 RepID=A0A2S5BAA0_9BASI|nr:hypothetical protein BMF94_3239 [Rhodotorula taiwanensis]
MSTRTESGMCLACGKEAKLRWSACATKSHLDLFFCSKEHQQLVWPFHRLVCGERAHPFALPPFSQEEADLLLDRVKSRPVTKLFADIKATLFMSLRIAQDDFLTFEVRGVLGLGRYSGPADIPACRRYYGRTSVKEGGLCPLPTPCPRTPGSPTSSSPLFAASTSHICRKLAPTGRS